MKNKIVRVGIVGATGKTGRAVVKQALSKGYHVIAVVRDPGNLSEMDGLEVKKGDAMDLDSLVAAFEGLNAIISCIGPKNNSDPGTLMSDGVRNMVKACSTLHIKKFVMMSGILQSEANELAWINKLLLKLIRIFYYEVWKDKISAEKAVMKSQLDWVIVRPAMLNETASIPTYIAGPEAKISPFKPLSYQDCADGLLRGLSEPLWIRRTINIGL